jgi:ABC-type multidrug transport system fused ATPase/permease subunit
MLIRSTVTMSAICNNFTAIAISSKGTFLLILVPLMFGYVTVSKYFRKTYIELQRLTSISRSPIYSHFSETLSGLSSVRALNATELFCQQNRVLVVLLA